MKERYEMFCNEWYYHMWCVRPIEDRRFLSDECIHFVKKEDAEKYKRDMENLRRTNEINTNADQNIRNIQKRNKT